MDLKEIAETIAKGGNVIETIQFNDIHHNNNVYVSEVGKAKPATGDRSESSCLSPYIFDDDTRKKVESALKECKAANALTTLLETLVESKTLSMSTLTDGAFREILSQLVGYQTTADAIRKAIDRDNKLS